MIRIGFRTLLVVLALAMLVIIAARNSGSDSQSANMGTSFSGANDVVPSPDNDLAVSGLEVSPFNLKNPSAAEKAIVEDPAAAAVLDYQRTVRDIYRSSDSYTKKALVSVAIDQSEKLIGCLGAADFCGQSADGDGFFDQSLTPLHHALGRYLEVLQEATNEDPEILEDIVENSLVAALKISHKTIPLTAYELLLAKEPTLVGLQSAMKSAAESFGPTRASLFKMMAYQDNQVDEVRAVFILGLEETFSSSGVEPLTQKYVAEQLHLMGLNEPEIRRVEKAACSGGIFSGSQQNVAEQLKWQIRRYGLEPKRCGEAG